MDEQKINHRDKLRPCMIENFTFRKREKQKVWFHKWIVATDGSGGIINTRVLALVENEVGSCFTVAIDRIQFL